MKVGEAVRLLERDGWILVAMRGSHRQYKHPIKPGRVTCCGKVFRGFGRGHAQQYLEAIRPQGAALMRYAVVIEKAGGNFSAHVPDLPGCVATGSTVKAVEMEIRDAIRFHIDGLKADGIEVPAPSSIAEYVET